MVSSAEAGHHFLFEENPHRVAELVSNTIREKGLAVRQERRR
jgi:hypothetical protein